MMRLSSVVCLLIGTSLRTVSPAEGDTEVSCVFMESCILPCSFQSGADPVIIWTQETAGHLQVHSFYSNKDQLGLQHQRFRNRTSLFKDQISRGNASLQLTGVEVQDQGGYKCHTSTMRGNKDSFINLRVDDPTEQSRHHFLGGERTTGKLLAIVIAAILGLIGGTYILIKYCIKKYRGRQENNTSESVLH